MSSAIDVAPTTLRCTRCGAEFSSRFDTCPKCGRMAGTQSARITLVVALLLIMAGLTFTQYFVNLHRATEASLANRWFTRGGQAMQAQMPMVAAQDYRTALSYSPENQQYRLRLAEALLAANRLNEARAHLTSLWEQEPANGEVNLALARLYSKRGDTGNAARYYSNAINGVWVGNAREQRIAVRFELANYLMEQHKLTEAQSELMALVADGPRETPNQLRLGQMLLAVNEPEHTIAIDNSILASDHDNAEAFLQKGQALLILSRYREAERSLSSAVEVNPKLAGASQQLDLAREVLRVDPALRGLSRSDRAKRAVEDFHAAWQRLTSCAVERSIDLSPATRTLEAEPTSSPGKVASTVATPASAPDALQLLYNSGLQRQASVTVQSLREDSDALDSTMQYVFEVERATASVCPNMSLTDQALLLLGQHESEALK